MCQYLPTKFFKWNDEQSTTERILYLLEDQDKGYLFEVDLHIPEDKHDYFNGYVPCPESLQVKKDNLSQWQQVDYKESKINKLCCSFEDKIKYVVNYRYLKLCLS